MPYECPSPSQTNAYIDTRETNVTKLVHDCPQAAELVTTVSLGDEISIRGIGNTTTFQAWCKICSASPGAGVLCSGIGGQKPAIPASVCSGQLLTSFANASTHPAQYYYSTLYLHNTGIAGKKDIITALGKMLKKAKFGANFSPTGYYTDPNTGDQNCMNYIGWTFQWVRVFREEGLTLPWGEDCA